MTIILCIYVLEMIYIVYEMSIKYVHVVDNLVIESNWCQWSINGSGHEVIDVSQA